MIHFLNRRKYAMAVLSLFFLALFSCKTKENILAIDVLLVPSEAMYTQALQLNAAIHESNPGTIELDADHIPHITLLQCFVNERDLVEIKNALVKIDWKSQDSLKAYKLWYDTSKPESFAMISIERNAALLKLHQTVIETLGPYFVENGSAEAFVPNSDGSPIDRFTVGYVPDFVEKYSYENFDPHISLGVAGTKLLDSLAENVFKPITFKAAALGIYQLGDHGTAQKLLWKDE